MISFTALVFSVTMLVLQTAATQLSPRVTRTFLRDRFNQAVLGLFLWEYGPCWDDAYTAWNAFNEVDIEYSRWGWSGNEIGQFVAQPWDRPGNLDRFDATFGADELASHAFRWLPDRLEFRSWRGGPDVPRTLVAG